MDDTQDVETVDLAPVLPLPLPGELSVSVNTYLPKRAHPPILDNELLLLSRVTSVWTM